MKILIFIHLAGVLLAYRVMLEGLEKDIRNNQVQILGYLDAVSLAFISVLYLMLANFWYFYYIPKLFWWCRDRYVRFNKRGLKKIKVKK